MASLSLKQFERNFKQEYGEVPVSYIQRIRSEAARQLLVMTDLPIAKIARETGFYDGSHLSHQFRKYTGLSPKAYREKHKPIPVEAPSSRVIRGRYRNHGRDGRSTS